MISVVKILVLTVWFLILSKCSVEPVNQEDIVTSLDKIENEKKQLISLKQDSFFSDEKTPLNFKVAIFGDSGVGRGFESVLELVKKEQADMVIHLGDFSYYLDHHYGAQIWDKKVNEILGEKYPYFLVAGNHEGPGWNSYVELFYKRLEHLPQGTCTVAQGVKDLGVKSYCNYKGVFMLLSGVGSVGIGHESFIRSALERNKSSDWKICAWHKNQNSLQLGHKPSEVGWAPYKLCQTHGAVVATGHEHSYGRTRTLTEVSNILKNQGAVGANDEVTLAPGKNFVSVIGTGGKSFRPYNCLKGALDPWWASIYTTNYVVKNREPLKPLSCVDNLDELKEDDQNTIDFGVLFLELNFEGQEKKARGRFVTTKGRVLDEFMVTKEN